jgi:hypothetical protein
MMVIPHPPYTPDLAPFNFFLFPCMKRQMKGKRFIDVCEVKKKCRRSRTSALKSSRNVFRSDKNVGTRVARQKGSTLMETRVVIA